jgi:hypothetical protein
MSDDEIAKQWALAIRLWSRRFNYRSARFARAGPNLAERLALRIVDNLENAGVTDADIDRLFGK